MYYNYVGKKRYEDGLKQSFHYLDHKMEHGNGVFLLLLNYVTLFIFVCLLDDTQQFQYERGGTTAIVVIIKDNHIICVSL